jgi:selenocysteine-specific elongation factor
MDVIVGTAGHIDHGKTALVKALTGVDADRLPEEKRRGITVDLGFAEMSVGDAHFGFIDVPGHERFVKNMLAGASGIDIVMLVIAADEGVMPQTREHFGICRLLGVNAGIVALTKSDLVDAETLELAKLDAAELVANSFLEGSPIIAVSSVTSDGLSDLRDALVAQARTSLRAENDRITLLPIDRSFSMKGFGTVVTGTLAAGDINEGDELELLPSAQKVRVRGLQTHGKTVKSVLAGQRAAVNLAGIDHSKITRGMVLAESNVIHPTQIIDARIEVLSDAAKPLRTRQRVRVHIGTSETLARIQVLNSSAEIPAGEKDFAQIRFETPVVAVPGERFIIRSYSPQTTIAGGVVIDVLAAKHRRRDFDKVRSYLRDLLTAVNDNASKVKLLVDAAGTAGLSFAELQSRTALKRNVLKSAIEENVADNSFVAVGERFVAAESFNALTISVTKRNRWQKASHVNRCEKRSPLICR